MDFDVFVTPGRGKKPSLIRNRDAFIVSLFIFQNIFNSISIFVNPLRKLFPAGASLRLVTALMINFHL